MKPYQIEGKGHLAHWIQLWIDTPVGNHPFYRMELVTLSKRAPGGDYATSWVFLIARLNGLLSANEWADICQWERLLPEVRKEVMANIYESVFQMPIQEVRNRYDFLSHKYSGELGDYLSSLIHLVLPYAGKLIWKPLPSCPIDEADLPKWLTPEGYTINPPLWTGRYNSSVVAWLKERESCGRTPMTGTVRMALQLREFGNARVGA